MFNPMEITFFVTNKCNLKCERCFNIGRDKKEMGYDELRNLCLSLPKFFRLQISGGEPFLKDLVNICYLFHFNNNVKIITIPTNGLLEDEIMHQVSKILLNLDGIRLHISISVNEIKDYPVINRLKLLKLRYPRLTIGTITTQTSQNERELDKIYDFCINTLRVDNFGFNIARITDKPNPKIYRVFTNKVAKTLPKFTFPMNYIYKAKRNLVFKYVYKMLTDPKYYMKCYSGHGRYVIDTDGTIHPCEMRLFSSIKEPMGKCFCQHECDMETNILLNPRFYPELIEEMFR